MWLGSSRCLTELQASAIAAERLDLRPDENFQDGDTCESEASLGKLLLESFASPPHAASPTPIGVFE
jgi:hypothetical protein